MCTLTWFIKYPSSVAELRFEFKEAKLKIKLKKNLKKLDNMYNKIKGWVQVTPSVSLNNITTLNIF